MSVQFYIWNKLISKLVDKLIESLKNAYYIDV